MLATSNGPAVDAPTSGQRVTGSMYRRTTRHPGECSIRRSLGRIGQQYRGVFSRHVLPLAAPCCTGYFNRDRRVAGEQGMPCFAKSAIHNLALTHRSFSISSNRRISTGSPPYVILPSSPIRIRATVCGVAGGVGFEPTSVWLEQTAFPFMLTPIICISSPKLARAYS